MEFGVPQDYTGKISRIDEQGDKFAQTNAVWFTNLDYPKRHEDLFLHRTYTPEEYPTYDNYDAIEVGKTKNIPMDYPGAMGVPITFLDKHNPDQFEIIGMDVDLITGFTGKYKSRFYIESIPLISRLPLSTTCYCR